MADRLVENSLGGAKEKNEPNSLEARYAREREEEYAKRDRLFNRLMGAENPKDVAAAIEVVRDFENFQFGETIDRWTFGAFKKAALDGRRAYGKISVDLVEDEIIEGSVGQDGYLAEGGRVRHPGYTIRVDQTTEQERVVIPHLVYDRSPEEEGATVIRKEFEVVDRNKLVEKPYFGPDAERKSLANAYEEFHRFMVTSELVQNQSSAFYLTRAGLEKMVDHFYFAQDYLTNKQIKWLFTAADIEKLTPQNPENQELGKRRDKASRLHYLVGMCETKEQMENFLNTTYCLEKILDLSTIERTLKVAEKMGQLNNMPETDDQKYVEAVRFLLGKNVIITRGPGGYRYEMVGWQTKDQRDPLKGGKGADAINDEKEARGFLTDLGNPYAEKSRDNLYMLQARFSNLSGDEWAVNDASRYMWTWGLFDELGLVKYTDEKNMPTGEEILNKKNTLSHEEWEKYAAEKRKLFTLTGEPTGSDLAKIIYPYYWRLKECLLNRPAGPFLTIDKFKRLTNSFLGLCSTEVDIVDGKGRGHKENRSIKEQWLGYKSVDGKYDEAAKNLGDIEWEQVRMPGDLLQEVGNVNNEVDLGAVRDNAYNYFWVMNWIAGRDDIIKAPWQFVMKGVENPASLMEIGTYTNKIKFWKILAHDNMIVWGDWRSRYLAMREANPGSSFEDCAKATEERAVQEAARILDKGQKDWYDGIRSMPDYSIWGSQQVKYIGSEGISMGTSKEIHMLEIVERLAVRFGFLAKEDYKKTPKNRFKVV